MEENCKFEPLIHKLGRVKDKVKSLSEVMAAANKYASSDKTRDASDGEEEEAAAKGRKTPTSSTSSKRTTTTRIKTNAKAKMVTQGSSPIRVEDSEASVEGAEDTAPGQSICKKFSTDHATFTRQVMDGQRIIPRRSATITRSGKKRANTTGEIPTKKTLVRLITQILGSTVVALGQ